MRSACNGSAAALQQMMIRMNGLSIHKASCMHACMKGSGTRRQDIDRARSARTISRSRALMYRLERC